MAQNRGCHARANGRSDTRGFRGEPPAKQDLSARQIQCFLDAIESSDRIKPVTNAHGLFHRWALTFPSDYLPMEENGIESVATPGELCVKTAELLGFAPNTTAIAWRALREASRVTTGGRGRSASHCVPADAANLLIAAIGKLPLKSYLKSWERFSNLAERGEAPRSQRETVPITDELGALKVGHSFGEGLEALLTSAKSGSLQAFFRDALEPDGIVQLGGVRIRLSGPYPQAFIDIHKNNERRSIGLHFDYSEIPTEMSRIIEWSDKGFLPDESGDLTQIMEISGKTIISLGEFLRLGERSK